MKKNSLYISNHDGYHDGAGAQTQRIFSIFCLASALELPFVYKPIEKVELQPIDFLTTEAELRAEIDALNNWIIRILAVQTTGNYDRTIRITKPTELPWRLIQLIFLGIFAQGKTKLTFLDCYFAARVTPKFWEKLPDLSQPREIDEPFEIHLHLRLTNFVVGDRAMGADFFQEVLAFSLSELDKKSLNYRVVVHTDFIGQVVSRDLLVRNAVPESLQYWKTLGLLDEKFHVNSKILLETQSRLAEIMSISMNTQIYDEAHWIEEWQSMGAADLLIIGKSSFSAVGGLLNQNGIVIGPNFWNSGKSNWCMTDNLDELKTWISARL